MRARHQAQPQATATVVGNMQRLSACTTFAEFYPLYLAEHRNPVCRRWHFAGSTLALACLFFFLFTGNAWWLLAGVISGYAMAWIGHYFFEHNRPASFKRPLYSLMGDWLMWWQTLQGKILLS